MSRFGRLFRATAAATLTAAGAAPATAQNPYFPVTQPDLSGYVYPNSVYPAGGGRRAAPPPGYTQVPCCPPGMVAPGAPTAPGTPPTMPRPFPSGDQPGQQPGAAPADQGAQSPSFSGLEGGAGVGQTVAARGGYIENAVPMTMFRLRYDSAYGNNRPDRAEVFYAKCGCFPDPNARGVPLPETKVDYQEVIPYFEYAFNDRFSMFADIPTRYINPEVNSNAAGLSDVSFGAKYAFIRDECRTVSLWLRTITPTGRPYQGLGSGNWWIEPGLLYLEQLSPKWQVFGELRGQFHITRESDFTGHLVRYGLGTSYVVTSGKWGYVAPVGEVVGWTVLSGMEADSTGMAVSARGDTIVNAKTGVRIGFGEATLGQAYPTRSDLYIGYGRALTGEVWYKNMLRVEMRFFF
jgi:hypothetical protein